MRESIQRKILPILLVCLTTLAFSGCTSPPLTRVEPPPRNYQAEVIAEFDRSIAGWNAGRLGAFISIYADDATFALHDRFLQGLAAIREYYAPRFAPGETRSVLRLQEFAVEVLSLDIVLVRAVYQSQRESETAVGTTTLIMRHVDNHWRIIHDHST